MKYIVEHMPFVIISIVMQEFQKSKQLRLFHRITVIVDLTHRSEFQTPGKGNVSQILCAPVIIRLVASIRYG
jgi:hypothetical protein